MNKVFTLLCFFALVGCSSSSDKVGVFGVPEKTVTQIHNDNHFSDIKYKKYAMSVERIGAEPSLEGLRAYEQKRSVEFNTPKIKYVENRVLYMYVYPKIDGAENVTPSYVKELPLYKKVHVLMPGEY